MMGAPAPALAKDDEIDKYVSRVMDTVGPLVATLGFSGAEFSINSTVVSVLCGYESRGRMVHHRGTWDHR